MKPKNLIHKKYLKLKTRDFETEFTNINIYCDYYYGRHYRDIVRLILKTL